MKITIEGTPEEMAKMLQAIESSKEQRISLKIDSKKVCADVVEAIRDKPRLR